MNWNLSRASALHLPPRRAHRCATPLFLVLTLALATTVWARPAQSPTNALESAQALLDQGRAQEARAVLDRLIKKKSKDARARLMRSEALFLLGEIELGRADLDRALELDPSLRQGWLNRAALELADQRYDAAHAALLKAQQLDPSAPDNDLNLGAVLLLKGDLAEAARSFQRHLDLHRNSAESHYLVATNYAMAGYAAPAVDLLRRTIQLDERTRLRARSDPNFAALANEPRYQQLMAQEPQRPKAGSRVARFLFARPYQGGKGELLPAVIDTLQAAGVNFDRRVEVTPSWALIWGEIRVELKDGGEGRGLVQFSAEPGAMSEEEWKATTAQLVRRIQARIVTLMAAKRKAAVQRRPPGG